MNPSLPQSITPLLLLLILLITGPLRAADDPLKGFSPEYQTTMRNAVRAFNLRDFPTALALMDKADSMYQATPMSLNVRGAIAIEQKRYEDGRKLCLEALKLDPKFFPAHFNLAEIPFVQGKYAEARLHLEKLLEDHPKDDLLRFRILLTYLLEKNDAAARERLDDVPFFSDTPAFYYSHAAWEFAHGNEKEARAWVDRGTWVFPPHKTINFEAVFYDLGWMKRPTAAPVESEKESAAPAAPSQNVQ